MSNSTIDPSEATHRPTGGWGPSQVFLGLLVMLGAASVEAGAVAVVDPGLDSLASRLAMQTLFAGTLVALAFILARPGGGLASPASLGLRRAERSPWRYALFAYLIYIGFAAVYAPLIQPEQEDVTRDLGFGRGDAGTVGAVLLVVVAAAVSEEIFFRGFMFGGLRRRMPFWAAAVISAAIFGLLHYTGPESLAVVPQLAVLGLLLAWVYERTGSILPTIGIHALNNGLALLLLSTT